MDFELVSKAQIGQQGGDLQLEQSQDPGQYLMSSVRTAFDTMLGRCASCFRVWWSSVWGTSTTSHGALRPRVAHSLVGVQSTLFMEWS